MSTILIAFFTSFILQVMIICSSKWHLNFSGDHDIQSIQKVHKSSVPRIGGLGILIALSLATYLRTIFIGDSVSLLLKILLFCLLPTFIVSIIEDIVKNIGVTMRLIATCISAFLFTYTFQSCITRVELPWIDSLLMLPLVAPIFTCVAITGLTNAYNLIDGFNGLASMVAMITLVGVGYIAFKVGDPEIFIATLTITAAIAGFFLFNYPKGSLFLGDSGAYTLGFFVATFCVAIITRHKEISPWFAILINAYPLSETIFTIWRRTVHRGRDATQPDAIHFHSLIYRRWLSLHTSNLSHWQLNARTSPFLWLISILAITPAVLWWNNTLLLEIFSGIFLVSYVYLYRSLVHFRMPWFIRLIITNWTKRD
jgi:UDP-GlcNAc:undecaprenyl-phosphate/decaprenyl-phosphate GlcNAc-1-phosphate transferase